MKKLPILFLTLVLAMAAADNAAACAACAGGRSRHHHARNEGFAVSVGAEFGIDNANNDPEPYFGVTLMYDETLLNGRLNIFIGLGYFFEFERGFDEEFNRVHPQTLTFDLGLAYNLNLRDTSTLSFLLESNNDFHLVPIRPVHHHTIGSVQSTWVSVLNPGIMFSETLGFGDISAQLGFPINFDSNHVDLELTLGWASNFGLALALSTDFHLSPSANAGWGRGLGAVASYSFGRFSVFAGCKFRNIGRSDNLYFCVGCGEYHNGDHANLAIDFSVGFMVSF